MTFIMSKDAHPRAYLLCIWSYSLTLKISEMSLIKFNQPSPLARRRNWVENFFTETDDFLKNWDWNGNYDVPSVNVKEEKENFLIDVAAPGMKKEDFKIDIENGVLMISAAIEDRKEENTPEFKRQEFSYKNFKRSFWLPENIAVDKIAARYENGLLKLTLPKMTVMAAPKGKKIEVV
jgi:HSP20 family protein